MGSTRPWNRFSTSRRCCSGYPAFSALRPPASSRRTCGIRQAAYPMMTGPSLVVASRRPQRPVPSPGRAATRAMHCRMERGAGNFHPRGIPAFVVLADPPQTRISDHGKRSQPPRKGVDVLSSANHRLASPPGKFGDYRRIFLVERTLCIGRQRRTVVGRHRGRAATAQCCPEPESLVPRVVTCT